MNNGETFTQYLHTIYKNKQEMCIQYNKQTGQFPVVVTCLFNSECFNCMVIVIN